jgi:hypothetical protein
MPRTRTILIEARDLIKDPENWNATGDYQRGKNCIVTAIFARCVHYSVGRDVSVRPAGNKVRAAIRDTAHVPKCARDYRGRIDIINWNDDPSTTHDDVMDVMNEAIRRASFPWEGVPA